MYLASWSALLLVALALAVRDRAGYALAQRSYWTSLAEPWKLGTFAVAAVGLVVVAPYTGDPTWDYVNASFMAILTFATAPWVAGTIYRAFLRRVRPSELYVAVCVWLFSASWSYDLYLLLRDGYYPITWASNVGASSVLYFCGGLMWSLEHHPDRGVIFSFMEPDWPRTIGGAGSLWILAFAFPFAAIVTVAILWFLL